MQQMRKLRRRFLPFVGADLDLGKAVLPVVGMVCF